MKSSWVGVGTLALVLLNMALGCVDNDRSLVIVYNVAPDDSCKWKIQTTGTDFEFIGTGLIDLSVRNVYWFNPQVENYMPANFNTSEQDLNTLAVQVERAEITYSWLGAGRDIIASYPELMDLEDADPFIAPLSGVVSAADVSGEPGKMVTSIPLFSPVVGDLFGEMLSADDMKIVKLGARVTIYGHTLGGVSIKSNEFLYPVEFCLGCTIGVMCCTEDPTKAKAATFCIRGQDSPQPCSC